MSNAIERLTKQQTFAITNWKLLSEHMQQ